MGLSRAAEQRRLGMLAIAGLVGVALTVLALRPPTGELSDLHTDLVTAAEEAGIGGTFHLADVAGFAWDQAHAFPPYSESLVSEELSFEWSPLSPAAQLVFGDLYLANEGLNLVVFVDGDDTVTGWSILGSQYLEQPYLEMSRNGSPVVIDRNADLVSVERPPFGPAGDAYLLATPER